MTHPNPEQEMDYHYSFWSNVERAFGKIILSSDYPCAIGDRVTSCKHPFVVKAQATPEEFLTQVKIDDSRKDKKLLPRDKYFYVVSSD